MSRFIALSAGMVVLALAAGAAFMDEHVSLADVPPAAVKAVKDRFPGAEIRDRVEKETKKAGVFHEFELLKNGKKIEAEVSPEGRFGKIEADLDAADLPKAVTDAIAAKYPSGRVTKAEEEIRFRGDRETKTFEVDIRVDGKSLDLKLDPDGKILEIDDD